MFCVQCESQVSRLPLRIRKENQTLLCVNKAITIFAQKENGPECKMAPLKILNM